MRPLSTLPNRLAPLPLQPQMVTGGAKPSEDSFARHGLTLKP